MSTIITRTRPRPAADWIPSPLARLTVDQYEALIDSGVFTQCDRFQLINGGVETGQGRGNGSGAWKRVRGVETGQQAWKRVRNRNPKRVPDPFDWTASNNGS